MLIMFTKVVTDVINAIECNVMFLMTLGDKFLIIVGSILISVYQMSFNFVERIAVGPSVDVSSSIKLERKEMREKLEAATDIFNHHNTVVHLHCNVDIVYLIRNRNQFTQTLIPIVLYSSVVHLNGILSG